VQGTTVTVQKKLKIRKRKRKEICLQFRFKCWQRCRRRDFWGKRVPCPWCGYRKFGKARSPIVRRRVEGTAMANDDVGRVDQWPDVGHQTSRLEQVHVNIGKSNNNNLYTLRSVARSQCKRLSKYKCVFCRFNAFWCHTIGCCNIRMAAVIMSGYTQ